MLVRAPVVVILTTSTNPTSVHPAGGDGEDVSPGAGDGAMHSPWFSPFGEESAPSAARVGASRWIPATWPQAARRTTAAATARPVTAARRPSLMRSDLRVRQPALMARGDRFPLCSTPNRQARSQIPDAPFRAPPVRTLSKESVWTGPVADHAVG